MQKIFKSKGISYNAEIFSNKDSYAVMFYNSRDEQYHTPLSDLVIVPSSYGFLRLKRIGEDAVLNGFLDKQYFTMDMIEDILSFLEDNLPDCKNIYLPYHIDFVSIIDYDEYNGEY